MLYKYNTVLLIDDSLIDNMISSKILQSSGFAEHVLIIDSPKKAISHIESSIDTGEAFPEVIFLDIRMPEMNGFDFLTKLYQLPGIDDQQFKLFILSSSLDPDDFNRVNESKTISRFIGKPLTERTLEEL